MSKLPSLVTCDWLQSNLHNPDIQIIDTSYFLPNWQRDCISEFENGHIPGAIFFDIDQVCAPDTLLPHMIPPQHIFEKALQDLGISPDRHLIFYDMIGLFSAPRGWWTFKIFGCQRLSVLEGGLPSWQAAGYPTEVGAAYYPPLSAQPKCNFDANMLADLETIKENLHKRTAQILDARPSERFTGQNPEPRPELRSGHIPGSFSTPFSRLLSENKLKFKNSEELEQAFSEMGINLSAPIITTCGSGVTAAILVFALHLLGKTDHRLYDGSWSEWGADPSLPIAKS